MDHLKGATAEKLRTKEVKGDRLSYAESQPFVLAHSYVVLIVHTHEVNNPIPLTTLLEDRNT